MHSVLIENHRSTQRANLQLHPRVFDPLNIFLWTMNANNMHTECLELVTPDRDKAAQSSNPEIRQQNANALSPTKLATLQGPSREMALHALYSSTSLLLGERKLDWERQATSNTNSGQKAMEHYRSSACTPSDHVRQIFNCTHSSPAGRLVDCSHVPSQLIIIFILLVTCGTMHWNLEKPQVFWASCVGLVFSGLALEVTTEMKDFESRPHMKK